MVENAVLSSDDLEFFFADGGLGIYVESLFTGYVEDFYLALIDELLGETGPAAQQ